MRHYKSELINSLGLPVEDTLSRTFLALTELFPTLEVVSDLGEFLTPPTLYPSSKLLVQMLTVFCECWSLDRPV